MKTLQLVLVFMAFALLGGSPAYAQKRAFKAKIVPIKSFTFTKKAYMNYKRQKAKPAAFTVNSRGKAYPAKGYKMAITDDKRFILVAPQEATFTANTGIDAHPANGGIYWCYCPGYPDDCTWETLGDPRTGEMTIVCEGSCDCGVTFEPDNFGGILDYETAMGGY